MTCPRCQQDNPSHANFCLGCGVHLGSIGESGPSGTPYVELQRALTEAQEQQAATSDILRVISGSPTDAQPVFDAIVRSALQLLGGHAAVLLYVVGGDVHVGAYTSTHRGGDGALASRYPMPVEELARQNPPLARVLVEGHVGHVPDTEAPSVDDFARSMARARGH